MPKRKDYAAERPIFDLIPAGDLAVDQIDFKASKWKPTMIQGRAAEYSECFEWAGGKWEGFVSIRWRKPKRGPRPLPNSILSIFKEPIR